MEKVVWFRKYPYNYIYKDKLIMEELKQRIDKLERTVDILKDTLREVLLKLKDNNTNPNLNNTNSDLVPKDRILIQSLLERSKEEFHTKFLSNILSSNYDTLTQKQYSVLCNIQNSI